MADTAITLVAADEIKISTNNLYSVVDIQFTLPAALTTTTDTAYFAAHLTDNQTPANTDDVLLSYTVTGNSIPATVDVAYTPTVTFAGTITGSAGKLYYK